MQDWRYAVDSIRDWDRYQVILQRLRHSRKIGLRVTW